MGVVCINLPMPRRWPEAQGRATPFQRAYGRWKTNVLKTRSVSTRQLPTRFAADYNGGRLQVITFLLPHEVLP